MEEISYFPSSPLWRTMSFIIISAMGERQILPWQMKRIFIMDTKLPSMPKYADLLRICKLHMSTSISTKFCKKRHNLPNCSSKNGSKAGFPYCRNFFWGEFFSAIIAEKPPTQPDLSGENPTLIINVLLPSSNSYPSS